MCWTRWTSFVEEAPELFVVAISPVHFQSWTWPAAASCHSRAASALALPPARAQFSGIQPAVVWGLWSERQCEPVQATIRSCKIQLSRGQMRKTTTTLWISDKSSMLKILQVLTETRSHLLAYICFVYEATSLVTKTDISTVLHSNPKPAWCPCLTKVWIRRFAYDCGYVCFFNPLTAPQQEVRGYEEGEGNSD